MLSRMYGRSRALLTEVQTLLPQKQCTALQLCRGFNIAHINRPYPNDRKYNYFFKVHYPADNKYTVKHLPITKLGGRHPVTGRIIVGTRGGGRKTWFRWVDHDRSGPSDGTFKEERIIDIQYDPNQTTFIALVGCGTHLRYILATTTMKPGDIVRSSSHIPEIPVRAQEGDSYPVGALPIGTTVCQIEKIPGEGSYFMIAAGTNAKIVRKLTKLISGKTGGGSKYSGGERTAGHGGGKTTHRDQLAGGGKVVVLLPNKHELALDPYCMVVVGQNSNPGHKDEHIGSPQRLRWLGWYPRSGLWQRKDGYCGRKIHKPPAIKHFSESKPEQVVLTLHCLGEGPPKDIIPSTRRKT